MGAAPAPMGAAPAPTPPSPIPLTQRLDQMALAGGTPARGTLMPPFEAALDFEEVRSAPTEDLLAALDLGEEELTRPLPAGGTIDAAMRDSLAELEATIEIPAQRRMAARKEALLTSFDGRTTTAGKAVSPVPSVPEPVILKEVPPPLPPAKPKSRPVPVATRAPAPVLSDAAPAPRVLQVLGEENTIPGLSPITRSSSSSGKIVQPSDQYRLQLEFEDTPARPLPRIAFVPPPPLPPSAKKVAKAPAAPAAELGELEAIDDLEAMARALGLDGVGDVSIPSLEGAPVFQMADEEISLPDLTAAAELFGERDDLDDLDDFDDLDDLDDGAPTRAASDVRRALALEALDHSIETAFPEKRASLEGPATRPALSARKAVTPVIVKIPSRPKVSLEARERARRLYLEAIEKLGTGDRTAAVLHLRLAIDYDDGIPLYRDLLSQLEAHTKGPRSAEGPALTVLGPRGERSQPRELWRSARPR